MSWYKNFNTTAGQVQQDVATWNEREAAQSGSCPEQVRGALALVATQLAACTPEQKVTIETDGHLDATSGTLKIIGRVWP